MYMINLVHVYKGKQSPKADSEKDTELPRTGFEPVTTELLVQCSSPEHVHTRCTVHVHCTLYMHNVQNNIVGIDILYMYSISFEDVTLFRCMCGRVLCDEP